VFSCDFETPLIRPGRQAPPPAAAGLAGDIELVEDPYCARLDVGGERVWIACAGSPRWHRVFELLAEHPVHLVNHRLQFDLACALEVRPDLAPGILGRARSGAAHCTEIRQRLIDIAAGCYSPEDGVYNLAAVAARHRAPCADKEGGWRLRYAELAGVPIARWPDRAVEYLAIDAVAPLRVHASQDAYDARHSGGEALRDAAHQLAAHLALELVSAHGIATDPVAVRRYRRQVEEQLLADRDLLERSGYLVYEGGEYRRRQKLFQRYVAALWRGLGIRGPQTKKSDPRSPTWATDADAAETSGDPLFLAYQRWGSLTAQLARVEEWERGVDVPVHTTFEMAETGRTRSRSPNTQNRDTEPGDRECVAPRPVARARALGGRSVVETVPTCYLVVDVPGLELRTVAQSCIVLVGYSRLAEVLNSGPDPDPHFELALELPALRGWSREAAWAAYETKDKSDARYQLVYRCRQTSKIANFSFPGGGGIETFRIQAWKKYRVKISHEEAKDLKAAWLRRWTEMGAYMRMVGRAVGGDGRATARQVFSGRLRGGCGYTDYANGFFQGLGADAAKEAMIELAWECYARRGGELHGCRVENFIHDEWLIAAPRDRHLAARARRVGHVVSTAANRWLPDVPVPSSIKVLATARWSKLADLVEGPDGLGVWEWSEMERERASLAKVAA
jgi:hypothetical protein